MLSPLETFLDAVQYSLLKVRVSVTTRLPLNSQHLYFRRLWGRRVELVSGAVCARHVALVVEHRRDVEND